MSPLRPLAVLILLAACGADGPPVAPAATDVPQAPEENLSLGSNAPETGVTVGGDARVGVVYEE